MSNTIQGLEKLQKQLAEIPHIDDNKDACFMGALVLQRYSMENAPVKTGFLRNSHKSRKTGEGAEMEVSAEYAGYVEFGTSKWKGHPFVRPAITQHSDDIVKAVAGVINTRLKKL